MKVYQCFLHTCSSRLRNPEFFHKFFCSVFHSDFIWTLSKDEVSMEESVKCSLMSRQGCNFFQTTENYQAQAVLKFSKIVQKCSRCIHFDSVNYCFLLIYCCNLSCHNTLLMMPAAALLPRPPLQKRS